MVTTPPRRRAIKSDGGSRNTYSTVPSVPVSPSAARLHGDAGIGGVDVIHPATPVAEVGKRADHVARRGRRRPTGQPQAHLTAYNRRVHWQ